MNKAKPRILAIDDVPQNLIMLGAALADAFSVQIATSGETGLALAAQNPPNLILLDVMMPEMDGFEVCRRLKADPRLKHIPVVFVTAAHDESSEMAGLALGAADYITKPVNVPIARQRIHNLLAHDEVLNRLAKVASRVPGVLYEFRQHPDGSACFPYASDAICAMYGNRITPADIREDASPVFALIHPDDLSDLSRSIEQSARQLTLWNHEYRIRCDNGTVRWLHGNAMPEPQADGAVLWHGFISDITERKQAEAAIRESEERWKLALDSTGDGVWDWYIQTGKEFFSPRLLQMCGYDGTDLENLSEEFDSRTHPDDMDALQRARADHFERRTPSYTIERRIRCKDGSWKWVLSRGMVISRDAKGLPLRMIGTFTDITHRKESEALIRQQAFYDSLTGLPNRRMLRDRLEQEIKQCNRDQQQLALIFIDLDHFKEVNDTLGHDQGDLLLVEAGRRIQACVRESDTVARMGGDEYTVILAELTDSFHLEGILQKILQTLSQVYQLGTEQVFVSASIGIALYPSDADHIENLLKSADQALYVAKGAGRNRFSFFTPALQEAAQTRVRLAGDLRTALQNHQFHVVYQPIIELATGAIHKAEAMIRWNHPTRGLVSPTTFIPIAESSGLIVEIGEWVFQQAAQQVRAWRQDLAPHFQISVNKSPVQFHHDGAGRTPWSAQLTAQGLPGDSIAVEITEGLLLNTSRQVVDTLLALRDAGIRVSLDDFGTGYSSLSYLQKFDIDFIKIDQSFVCHLIAESTELALCKAIIVMAHALGIQVIAEGVETAEQRDLLATVGCDFVQGYLYARPMRAADFDAFMAAYQPRPLCNQ